MKSVVIFHLWIDRRKWGNVNLDRTVSGLNLYLSYKSTTNLFRVTTGRCMNIEACSTTTNPTKATNLFRVTTGGA